MRRVYYPKHLIPCSGVYESQIPSCTKQRLPFSPSSLNWRAFFNKASNILLEMERQKQVFILLLAKVTENDDETY